MRRGENVSRVLFLVTVLLRKGRLEKAKRMGIHAGFGNCESLGVHYSCLSR